jgi:hypothetical protein
MFLKRLLVAAVLSGLAFSLTACKDATSPTEPDSKSAVHVVGQNASGQPMWLPEYVNRTATRPVSVLPGGTVELCRRSYSNILGDSFFVYRAPNEQVLFAIWAEVHYNIRFPSNATPSETTLGLRFLLAPSGELLVTSDRPDVLQVVSVTYPNYPTYP